MGQPEVRSKTLNHSRHSRLLCNLVLSYFWVNWSVIKSEDKTVYFFLLSISKSIVLARQRKISNQKSYQTNLQNHPLFPMQVSTAAWVWLNFILPHELHVWSYLHAYLYKEGREVHFEQENNDPFFFITVYQRKGPFTGRTIDPQCALVHNKAPSLPLCHGPQPIQGN